MINRDQDEKQAQILQQMLAQANVSMTIDAMERAALNSSILTGTGNDDVSAGVSARNPG